METIVHAVGIRNGVTTMPNKPDDVETVTGLLDRVPPTNGGTAATPGLWSRERTALLGEVAGAIAAFQTANQLSVVDGVVDPHGRTLRLLNQLAGPGPVTARVVWAEANSQPWVVAQPVSVEGTGDLLPGRISPAITRRLVRVTGTSIKWFGVVVPMSSGGGVVGGVPHIFFTPTPAQGGYFDGSYDEFTQWADLWDKYTSIIGSQLVVSGAPQILVIPFYKNAQTGRLGSFLTNWREAVGAVLTAAVDSINPLFLRDRFEFDGIYTSSFSNGIATLQNFTMGGDGVAAMTLRAFDLDGQASGSTWRPSNGIRYRNTRAPRGVNPVGDDWFVGGRFALIRESYSATTDHNLCPFLLLHGLTRFGR
jgi:hypothetical protein